MFRDDLDGIYLFKPIINIVNVKIHLTLNIWLKTGLLAFKISTPMFGKELI
jgi:hypothetical protein